MTLKSTLLLLSTAAGIVAGAVPMSAPASAQDWQAREAELVGLHQLCDRGDRKACVRFGMILAENHEHHDDWRHRHAEFFWWEH
jgi:hypothetical protein